MQNVFDSDRTWVRQNSVNDMKGRSINYNTYMVCKYGAYFHALFLIFLIFVLATNTADKSKKIPQTSQLTVRELQYAIAYV